MPAGNSHNAPSSKTTNQMPYNNTSMTREVPFNMMSTLVSLMMNSSSTVNDFSTVNPMMNSSSTVNDFSKIDLAQLMSTFNIEPRSQEQVDFHTTSYFKSINKSRYLLSVESQ